MDSFYLSRHIFGTFIIGLGVYINAAMSDPVELHATIFGIFLVIAGVLINVLLILLFRGEKHDKMVRESADRASTIWQRDHFNPSSNNSEVTSTFTEENNVDITP